MTNTIPFPTIGTSKIAPFRFFLLAALQPTAADACARLEFEGFTVVSVGPYIAMANTPVGPRQIMHVLITAKIPAGAAETPIEADMRKVAEEQANSRIVKPGDM